MIRDITIGQYYPAESPIHKLDPRVKLFATLIYIIALFCYKGIAGLAFIVLCLAAVIKISKVPFKFMVKGLKTIIVLLVIAATQIAQRVAAKRAREAALKATQEEKQ